ncbi:MAG: amidohydrolase [Thermoprotei archaeon]
MDCVAQAEGVHSYVVSVRRFLHQHPELSFQEFETANRIEAELRAMGLSPKRMAGTGVVADIEGGHEGRTVAIRADIDALPVQEENRLEYASKNKGIMHACGHDAHVAMLLGVAKILKERDDLRGRVRLIFQPAEEQPPGGAQLLIKEGVLNGVDYIIGQHVFSNISAGKVAIYYGPLMANSDKFVVRLHGRGGHGSAPHETVDPIVAASYYVTLAQTIVSRRVDPVRAAVVSFGTFNAGYRFNIIASHAELTGTVRTLDDATRGLVRDELKRLLEGVCSSMGLSYEFEYEEGYPVVINNPDVAKVVEAAVVDVLGEGAVLHPDPVMGGEDFGYYMQKIPGAFYFLGVGNPTKGITSPQHSPTYNLDEDALKHGVAILCNATLKLLNHPS